MELTVVTDFLKTHATELIWIVILFVFGKAVLKLVVDRMKRLADDGDDRTTSSLEQRMDTLGSVITATGNAVIYVVIILMILNVFGIDIRPILAGAGIIGLAVGFGAQSLVKDFVSGLFILVENQYAVGDSVKIGSFEGKVKRITMRSTVLENQSGDMIYISNGSVTNVTNKSRPGKQ